MYLHIGKDVIIKSENLVTILNIESLEKKNSLENICKNLNINDNIIDISDNNKKSLIIINKKEQLIGYISNISTMTLKKRTAKYERMDRK